MLSKVSSDNNLLRTHPKKNKVHSGKNAPVKMTSELLASLAAAKSERPGQTLILESVLSRRFVIHSTYVVGTGLIKIQANTLINAAIDNCTISQLRAVVLDELHMLDDDHRGYLMELIATKLLSLDHDVQIIGMSATLQNIDLLSRWLHSHVYSTSYRPVPIDEYLVHEGKIYPASSTSGLLKAASQLISEPNTSQLQNHPVRVIQPSLHKEFQNDLVLNAVVALATETAKAGYGALVFCSSRWLVRTHP